MPALVVGNTSTVAIPAVVKTTANLTSLSVTPSTTSQNFTPTSPVDGYNSVSVSAVDSTIDSNIIASNIKENVTILGVTGTFQGGGGPTGFGVSGDYLLGNANSSGEVVYPSTPINMSFDGLEKVPRFSYYMAYMFYANPSVGSVTFSDLTDITRGTSSAYSGYNYIFYYTFSGSSITSFSCPSLQTVQEGGGYTFYGTFYECRNLSSVDFSNLTTVNCPSQSRFMCYMCYNCTSLTNINFSSLTSISMYDWLFYCTFNSCSNLTTVSFPSLTTASLVSTSGQYIFHQTFGWCSSLTTARFPSLTTIGFPRTSSTSYGPFYQCFRDCSHLTDVYFNQAMTWGNATNPFNQMLYNCSGVTVHFKSSMQSAINALSSAQAGFGGTNTTILFDL